MYHHSIRRGREPNVVREKQHHPSEEGENTQPPAVGGKGETRTTQKERRRQHHAKGEGRKPGLRPFWPVPAESFDLSGPSLTPPFSSFPCGEGGGSCEFLLFRALASHVLLAGQVYTSQSMCDLTSGHHTTVITIGPTVSFVRFISMSHAIFRRISQW